MTTPIIDVTSGVDTHHAAALDPQGRNDGGTLKLYHFPQVHVSALGVDRVIGGPKTLAFHNTIHTPGCDAL